MSVINVNYSMLKRVINFVENVSLLWCFLPQANAIILTSNYKYRLHRNEWRWCFIGHEWNGFLANLYSIVVISIHFHAINGERYYLINRIHGDFVIPICTDKYAYVEDFCWWKFIRASKNGERSAFHVNDMSFLNLTWMTVTQAICLRWQTFEPPFSNWHFDFLWLQWLLELFDLNLRPTQCLKRVMLLCLL